MKRYQLILIVLLSYMLINCTSQTSIETTATFLPTEHQQMIANSTLTSTLLPTVTKTVTPRSTLTLTPRPTLTLTPMPTATPTTNIQYQNIIIEGSVSTEVEGVLVIDDLYSRDNKSYLLNLQTGKEILFPVMRVRYVSPDRKLVAYFDRNSNQLQIVTANGQMAFSYPIHEDWYQVTGWLDNERLSINHHLDDAIQTILNVYTGEWQELYPSFPSVSDDGRLMSFDPIYFFAEDDVIYDPILSRTIISRFSSTENRSTLELWNHQAQQSIWKETDVNIRARPVWSPNGDFFTAVYSPSDSFVYSLYLIGYDGQKTKLTNGVAGGATWSPDGRHVATGWRMRMEIDGFYYDRAVALAVIDVVSKEITVYKIASYTQYIVWSPDGRYVALDNVLVLGDEPEETKTQVVIVDLVENRAFVVTQDANVIGWMASPQE